MGRQRSGDDVEVVKVERVLLTVEHAAEALDLGVRTVRRLIADGELVPKYIGVGRYLRVTYQSILDYAAALPEDRPQREKD
jgi:excisionase family DNA binding protein